MQNVRDRTVIPRHEETADEEGSQEDPFFVGLNGEKNERSGKEESGSDDDDAAVGVFSLETVGEKTSREDAQKERQQRDYGQRKSGFAKTEFLIIDGKVDAPGEERDAGESDTGSGD